jgi:hypothetical protein
MRHQESIRSVRLVWPRFGQLTEPFLCSRDGVARIKRRAFVRAAALWARPLNVLVLIACAISLLAGARAALPLIVSCGLLALVLEKGAEAPKRRRRRRILRDVRPLLCTIELPDTKRAGRINRAQPHIVIPDLPPDRPRSRISERRPGPDDSFFE